MGCIPANEWQVSGAASNGGNDHGNAQLAAVIQKLAEAIRANEWAVIEMDQRLTAVSNKISIQKEIVECGKRFVEVLVPSELDRIENIKSDFRESELGSLLVVTNAEFIKFFRALSNVCQEFAGIDEEIKDTSPWTSESRMRLRRLDQFLNTGCGNSQLSVLDRLHFEINEQTTQISEKTQQIYEQIQLMNELTQQINELFQQINGVSEKINGYYADGTV